MALIAREKVSESCVPFHAISVKTAQRRAKQRALAHHRNHNPQPTDRHFKET
jgi:hypothetical protein